MNKRLLCPQRLRHVPHQFSWIDQRLLRDGHIARCGGPRALALYLLLVAASDAHVGPAGVSPCLLHFSV
jgi:hypothetical protein